jgi:outer membrane protein OmpA-like peptidoglycan-associated protein
MKRLFVICIIAAFAVSMFGCASMKRRDKGAIIGAAAGGVIGGVIGNKAGNTAVGAILGAAVGGAAGAYIGDYMDDQAAEMEADLEGARVERVGEGIKITFASGILFDIDKSTLQAAAQENLTKLGTILNKYSDTEVLIEGHTDNTGSNEHNMDLSIRRAQSVANYLESQNVSPARFRTMGYGEDQPIAANETLDGRTQNRRVEIAIFANDKLKKTAEKQIGG